MPISVVQNQLQQCNAGFYVLSYKSLRDFRIMQITLREFVPANNMISKDAALCR